MEEDRELEEAKLSGRDFGRVIRALEELGYNVQHIERELDNPSIGTTLIRIVPAAASKE